MSNQNSWNQGRNDANSGKGAANTNGLSYQDRQAYDAGYKQQQQQQQQNQSQNQSGNRK